MSSRSPIENIQGCLQSFNQISKTFPAKDQDLSSISLTETVQACTEQFEQMLELFPDEDKASNNRLPRKALYRVSKLLHGTDKDSIHGLSRKMISHEHERFNSWIAKSQHILDNESELAASRYTGYLLKLMLESLVDMKESLTHRKFLDALFTSPAPAPTHKKRNPKP